MKSKLLCILHRAPPAHGASKVGDFIATSEKLKAQFKCRFITIKSSDTLGDIGKINFKKIYFVFELYLKVFWALLIFRPQKIYFTASVKSVAFYRDLLISTLWKVYKQFMSIDVYYHYHTKGINDFVSASKRNLKLTRFFIKDVNIILLSPMLKKDFDQTQTFKQVLYLPNGVKNIQGEHEFNKAIEEKYQQQIPLNVLYLSNMIKSKGYFSVLELANQTKGQSIHYHFAGGWGNVDDEKEFFNYIDLNELKETVTFHGFVKDREKQQLFKRAHLFIFPTRYKNEAFPLSILEALSYGIPVIATDEASIPSILDKKSGIIINDMKKLLESLELARKTLINIETAKYCRTRFLKHFTQEKFETNLVDILKGKTNV